MTRLLHWVDDGRIQALPIHTYPLAQAALAHQELESGQTVGKLVLIP